MNERLRIVSLTIVLTADVVLVNTWLVNLAIVNWNPKKERKEERRD